MYGVTFSLEGGGTPAIAAVGGPATSFYGPPGSTGPDTPAPAQGVGGYFLTDDGIFGLPPVPLIVGYAFPVWFASGQLLDIDGDEAWLVEAGNGLSGVIDSITLTPASFNAGDGNVTPFVFEHLVADIEFLRFSYVGPGASGGIGFGLDNFSPVSRASREIFSEPPPLASEPVELEQPVVPEPATLTTSLLGLGYLMRRVRRRRS